MLLLIDPSEEIVRLINNSFIDKENKNKIEQIFENKQLPPNKDEFEEKFYSLYLSKTYSQALTNNFRMLLSVPKHILEFIDEIRIINILGGIFELQPSLIVKVCNSLKADGLKSRCLESIKDKVSIKNIPVFNESGTINYTILLQSIKGEEIISQGRGKSSIIFFDKLLTYSVITEILLSLLNNIDIVGYRYKENSSKDPWEPIKDMPTFLLLLFLFNSNYLVKKGIFSSLLPLLYPALIKSQLQNMILSIKSDKERVHVCLFAETEFELQLDFANMLNKEIGPFQEYICSQKGYTLPYGTKRLIIMNFDVLNTSKQSRLLQELENEKNYYEYVVIITRNTLLLNSTDKVKIWPGFAVSNYFEGIEKIGLSLNNYARKKINEYQYVVKNIIEDVRIKKKLIESLDKQLIADDFLNIKKINFWYDLPDLSTDDENELLETVNTLLQQYFIVKRKKHYKISLLGNNWEIIVDNNEDKPIQISFSKSNNMKYLVYLYRHYSNGRVITFDKLLKVIDGWSPKNTKIDSNMKFTRITDDLSRMFKKHPELNDINQFIERSKLTGCFYRKNNEIEIELHLDDKDIPEPV